jgi:hypothetical protein
MIPDQLRMGQELAGCLAGFPLIRDSVEFAAAMKSLIILALSAFLSLSAVQAKEDVPRGYSPLSEVSEALTKSGGKKLIMLLVKGKDDNCPHCTAAVANGEKAVGSGVIQVFARAEELNPLDKSKVPPALKERAKQPFTTGASVCIIVFNPDMTKIVAEGERNALENDKEVLASIRKQVTEAKKALK